MAAQQHRKTNVAAVAARLVAVEEQAVRAAPPAMPRTPPVYLSVRGMCELLDVSESTYHRIRDQEWMPRPIALSPKVLRWNRHEVEEALRMRAPRLAAGESSEPESLVTERTGRRFRSGVPE